MNAPTNTKASILCLSSSDWDGKWGSRQQVAMRWARRGHAVVFVEQMAGLEHFAKNPDLRRRRKKNRTMHKQAENLWLLTPPPLLPGRYYLPMVNRLNGRFMARWLQSQLQKLSFTPDVLWTYKPEHAAVAAHFSDTPLIYHCIDEFTVGTNGRKRTNIIQQEKDVLQQAMVVFANSILTYENKRRFNSHTYRIPSGADVAHFNKANQHETAVSPHVAHLPHPILMFAGNINEKIDIALLAHVATEQSHWSIVLIGQAYGNAKKRLSGFENIHFLGKRPFADLPTFFRAADICLLPYVNNESTRYRSPLKLYEYLATGKPIISTPHPEVAEFADIISITPPANFIAATESALKNDTEYTRKQRLQIANQHSWDGRVAEMDTILQEQLAIW